MRNCAGRASGRRKGRKLPGLAKRTSAIAGERQSVRPAGLRSARVKMPEFAARIAHAAAHGGVANAQYRRAGLSGA